MNAKKVLLFVLAVLCGLFVWLPLSMARERESSASKALEWRVAPLPGDNLIKNPWFRKGNQPSLEGWIEATVGHGGWTASQKPGNPTPDGVVGTAARISTGRGAQRTGWTVDPGVDAVLYQVVAADPMKRTLKFDLYWVTHTVNPAVVTIYGSTSEHGPWIEVWQPYYQVYTKMIVPESRVAQELWRYYSQTTDLETIALDRGYRFYKVEINANLPDKQGGFKITGIYFAVDD